MVAPVIVMRHKGLDLRLQITRQEVVLQQDAVLERLVPAFDLALCHRVIRRPTHMAYTLALQPGRQIRRDVA